MTRDPEPRPDVGGLWLFAWLLTAVACDLFPFSFQAATHSAGLALASWSRDADAGDFVLNILMFVPLGVLLHRRWRHQPVGWTPIVIAGIAGLLISFSLESLQAFLPGRDTNLTDLVANTAGALAGAGAYRRWGAIEGLISGPWIARLRGRASITRMVGLMLGFTVLSLVTSGALQLRSRLTGWSPDYPLLVGNERTGNRPWRGRVFAFELTDAATRFEAVREFSRGVAVAIPGRRVAAFDFSGSPPYVDGAGELPSLEWTEQPSPGHDAGGIRLPGRPWLHTTTPASEIAYRLGKSNAFTIHLACATDDIHQSGPARIVSNSLDAYFRNFTVAQVNGNMVFRLRTPHNGLNGARPEVIIRGVFATDRRREILVTYDGGTLLAAVANSGRVQRTDLTPGSSLALAITGGEVSARELRAANLLYLTVLFLVPGLVVGLSGPTHRSRWMAGLIWAPAFSVLLEGTLVLASGRAYDWGRVAENAFAGAAILILAMLCSSDRRRLHVASDK